MQRQVDVIYGIEGIKLSDWEIKFFKKTKPFGIILFSRNIKTPTMLSDLTTQIRDVLGQDIYILIDQEGGRVARLKEPHWQKLPPVGTYLQDARGDIDKASIQVKKHFEIISEQLNQFGINMNCAPIADLYYPNAHDIIGDRSFSANIDEVVILADLAANILRENNIIPIMKHIPGHGRANCDSHEELPIVNTKLSELMKTDFLVFKKLNHIEFAMTAHVKYSDIDNLYPATLSKKMIGLIRNDLGYKNKIMTDDLSMKALTGSFADRVKKSLDAGCDIILHCNGNMQEMQEINNAVEEYVQLENNVEYALGNVTDYVE